MNEIDFTKLIQTVKEQLIGEILPVGAIITFAGTKAPTGFMICDGRELLIDNYPALYAVIGQRWGGSKTTFCLPDLRGQFVRGWDNEGNTDPERDFGSAQDCALQGHGHEFLADSLVTDSDGSHRHDTYWGEFKMRDASYYDSNNHYQYLPIKCENFNSYFHDRVGTDYQLKEGISFSGAHTHGITTKCGHHAVGNPTTSTYSPITGKVSTETRPCNIALNYIIKIS